jgi:hypothetical protein
MKKNTLVTFLFMSAAIFVCVLITGSGVYYWQRTISQKNQTVLQEKIGVLEQENIKLQQQIDDLGRKLCQGTWKDGVCTVLACGDSDANESPNEIYIKGIVTYTDESGVPATLYDECNGSKTQVNEGWCYENPEGSGNYTPGVMVYDCPFGCFDGACNK